MSVVTTQKHGFKRTALHFVAMRLTLFFAFTMVSLCASAQHKGDVWTDASKASGVPVKILHGIALVESGKQWSDGSIRPWPWTLNSPVKGSQFFNSKEAAEHGLNALLAAGVKNIDIGIMQINCGYHCSRVNSPSDLLDPNINIRVASKILAEVRTVKGDLEATVGAYHAGLHPKRMDRVRWYQDAVARRVRQITGTKKS